MNRPNSNEKRDAGRGRFSNENRSEPATTRQSGRETLVEGCPGQESERGRASYLALFSFSTREMKIKEERAFVIYARRAASDLSAARPVASNARHYCVCPLPSPVRNALL